MDFNWKHSHQRREFRCDKHGFSMVIVIYHDDKSVDYDVTDYDASGCWCFNSVTISKVDAQ